MSGANRNPIADQLAAARAAYEQDPSHFNTIEVRELAAEIIAGDY